MLFFAVNAGFAERVSVQVGEYSAGRSVRVSASYSEGNFTNLSITIEAEPRRILRDGGRTRVFSSTIFVSRDIESFRDFLLQVKERQIEWMEIARENRLDRMRREMDFVSPPISFSWGSMQDIQLQSHRVELQPVFVWTGGRRGTASVEMIGMLEVSWRHGMQVVQGSYPAMPRTWTLSTVAQINNLLALLEPERIRTALEAEIRTRTEREDAQREVDNLFR